MVYDLKGIWVTWGYLTFESFASSVFKNRICYHAKALSPTHFIQENSKPRYPLSPPKTKSSDANMESHFNGLACTDPPWWAAQSLQHSSCLHQTTHLAASKRTHEIHGKSRKALIPRLKRPRVINLLCHPCHMLIRFATISTLNAQKLIRFSKVNKAWKALQRQAVLACHPSLQMG